MTKYDAALGKEGIEAAHRIRDRLVGEQEGDRDIYMCHGFCELGALQLVPVLRDMRDFLVANPGEVLIIVIQDEASVIPQATVMSDTPISSTMRRISSIGQGEPPMIPFFTEAQSGV